MTNKEILSSLAGIESALYYRRDGSDDPQNVSPEDIETAYKKARDLLELWHSITGEILKD